MEPDELWDLLPEFFAGLCSDEQVDAINRWIESDPLVKKRVERERLTWDLASRLVDPVPGADVAASVNRLKARIAALATGLDSVLERPPLKVRRIALQRVDSTHARVALPSYVTALVAASVLFAVVFYGHTLLGAGGWLGRALHARMIPAERAEPRSYAAARGERLEVALPDGSRMILAPATTALYLDSGGSGRSVQLRGQAYFEVVHDVHRPFVVSTANTSIRDVGTTFTVRAYDQNVTSVAVRSGSVTIRPIHANGDATVGLTAGDVATVDISGPAVRHDQAAGYFSWTRGEITLTNVPLQEVLEELERQYDVVIRLTPAIDPKQSLNVHLTGADATHALSVVSKLVHGVWRRDGKTILIDAGERSQ